MAGQPRKLDAYTKHVGVNAFGQAGIVFQESLILGKPGAALRFRSKLQVSRVSWSHPYLRLEHHSDAKAVCKCRDLFNPRVAFPATAKANLGGTTAHKAERNESNCVHTISWKSGQHVQCAVRAVGVWPLGRETDPLLKEHLLVR